MFAIAQLQIDSVIAGYAFFLYDPRLNIAKTMLAICSFVNTAIVLSQMRYYNLIRLDDDFFSVGKDEIKASKS